ncbi:hypothetical protein [Nocardia sp. NPDC049149]|uniref:hypothetical protein n=1 Tax=Nocardia sp. NPDC049149 TaxID=3364315 RepID=UPI00371A2EF1
MATPLANADIGSRNSPVIPAAVAAPPMTPERPDTTAITARPNRTGTSAPETMACAARPPSAPLSADPAPAAAAIQIARQSIAARCPSRIPSIWPFCTTASMPPANTANPPAWTSNGPVHAAAAATPAPARAATNARNAARCFARASLKIPVAMTGFELPAAISCNAVIKAKALITYFSVSLSVAPRSVWRPMLWQNFAESSATPHIGAASATTRSPNSPFTAAGNPATSSRSRCASSANSAPACCQAALTRRPASPSIRGYSWPITKVRISSGTSANVSSEVVDTISIPR